MATSCVSVASPVATKIKIQCNGMSFFSSLSHHSNCFQKVLKLAIRFTSSLDLPWEKQWGNMSNNNGASLFDSCHCQRLFGPASRSCRRLWFGAKSFLGAGLRVLTRSSEWSRNDVRRTLSTSLDPASCHLEQWRTQHEIIIIVIISCWIKGF